MRSADRRWATLLAETPEEIDLDRAYRDHAATVARWVETHGLVSRDHAKVVSRVRVQSP
ncbi:MAG: hypothetical protein ABI548_14720 [Polyangiaceae bacterium]